MAFKFLGQRQLGKLPSRWVSTILMVAIGCPGVLDGREKPVQKVGQHILNWLKRRKS